MKRKGQAQMMIGLGVALIITVIILGVVFTFLTDNALTLTTVSEEDHATTDNVSLQLDNDRIVTSSMVIRNGTLIVTDNIDNRNWSLTETTGQILVFNNSGFGFQAGATLTYNYSFRPDGFVDDGTTRTIISIIPLLLAIVLLVFAVGFIAIKGKS